MRKGKLKVGYQLTFCFLKVHHEPSGLSSPVHSSIIYPEVKNYILPAMSHCDNFMSHDDAKLLEHDIARHHALRAKSEGPGGAGARDCPKAGSFPVSCWEPFVEIFRVEEANK